MPTPSVCPLCGTSAPAPFLQCEDRWISREQFTIVRCTACDFTWTIDAPGEEEMSRYYTSREYAPLSSKAAGWLHRLGRWMHVFLIPHRCRFVERVSRKKRGRLLDIGCGTGEFMAAMQNRGWDVLGIEPSAEGISQTHARGCAVLKPEDIARLPDHSSDCIMIWHVLEHVPDFAETLSHIRRLLRSDGTCIIAVPNCASWEAKIYGTFWSAWDVPRHRWHFTHVTLTHAIEHAQMTLTRIASTVCDPVYICLRSTQYGGTSTILGWIRALRSTWIGMRNPTRASVIVVTMKPTA